jgi:hypothetical protein
MIEELIAGATTTNSPIRIQILFTFQSTSTFLETKVLQTEKGKIRITMPNINPQNIPQTTFNSTVSPNTSSFKCPLVLPTNLFLFIWGEVILDVKGLADLLWRLPLDHVCYSLACQIQKALYIQIVCSLKNANNIRTRLNNYSFSHLRQL